MATLGLLAVVAGWVGVGIYQGMHSVIIDPQGSWQGPWPLDGADDCRTRLYSNGRFEMECRAKDRYAGTGTWFRQGNELTFQFNLFVRNGEQDSAVKEIVLRTDGTRNTMFVGQVAERGEPHRWQRQRL